MAFCRLVFPILLLSVISCYASIHVPVFMWGDFDGKSSASSPLSALSKGEFRGILKRELSEDPFTVIFIDETLSPEDLSHRNSDGDTSFPFLHSKIGHALYLPSVHKALPVLYSLADPEKVDHVKLTENGLSAEIEPESGKYLFIFLKDAQEGDSRYELLKRHNDFMEEMYTKLNERYDKVVAIYTAENPSWVIPESHSRERRQANETLPTATDSNYVMNGVLLYAKSIIVNNGTDNIVLTGFSNSQSTFSETSMSTEMTFKDNTLTLIFNKYSGYWYFANISIEQTAPQQFKYELAPESELYAFLNFSYRCGETVSFKSNENVYSVTFKNIKVQPFFNQSDPSNPLKYGDALNCVGFFTAPIWSGLFVTAILLTITFYGIMMMMDIRTMDRFDDPKGKTITINAGE